MQLGFVARAGAKSPLLWTQPCQPASEAGPIPVLATKGKRHQASTLTHNLDPDNVTTHRKEFGKQALLFRDLVHAKHICFPCWMDAFLWLPSTSPVVISQPEEWVAIPHFPRRSSKLSLSLSTPAQPIASAKRKKILPATPRPSKSAERRKRNEERN
jgi:hypothetical protein